MNHLNKQGMTQSSESYLGEHFLKSEHGEREGEGEQENHTVKTKKAPLWEGPNVTSKSIQLPTQYIII